MNKAEELIACLEGEIAKRDARIFELESRYQRDVYGLNNEGDPIGGDPAGGYANDNMRLRAELAAIKEQEPVAEIALSDDGYKIGLLGALRNHRLPIGTKLYAAPVSEAKAQGVVMPERETELFNAAHGTAVESGWESVKCMARQIWDAARLNADPAAPAADAGLVEALESIAMCADGYSGAECSRIARSALKAYRAAQEGR